MAKGIIFALAACFIWGLIFVIPQMLEGFTPLEVAFGRYFFYGIFSSMILLRGFAHSSFRHPSTLWIKSLKYSFFTSFGYYPFVVLSLRYATPAICALILGISPITIAFYGKWRENEGNYRFLIWPSILILIGLAIINAPQLAEHDFPATFLWGLACSLIALSTWTWYAVSNARLLKMYPELPSSDWSTLMGVSTFFWVVFFGVVYTSLFSHQIEYDKYLTWNSTLSVFLVGTAVLGFVCSWVGAYLWNKASFHLPVSMAGQLLIFETIFGLLFVYLYEQMVPPVWEIAGIAILLSAIYVGVKKSIQAEPSLVVASD